MKKVEKSMANNPFLVAMATIVSAIWAINKIWDLYFYLLEKCGDDPQVLLPLIIPGFLVMIVASLFLGCFIFLIFKTIDKKFLKRKEVQMVT
jgi:hypothetical protein